MSKLKVGIFVLVGLVLTMFAVFLIGQGEHAWQTKEEFRASFKDVAGLKAGASVQLGGVDIGTVSSVAHSSDPADTRIHVSLSVVKAEARRIRQGAVARIQGRGLLGDKTLEISVPNPDAPQLPEDGELETEEPGDLFSRVQEISEKAKKAMENVEAATRPLANGEFSEELKSAVHNLNVLLGGIAKNDSVAHRILLDPNEGARFDRLLGNLEAATGRLDAAMVNLEDVTQQVKAGPGLAHALVYDGDLSTSAAGSLEEVHKDLEAIRTGNGIAHSLIFGDGDTQHLMGNVNAMSDDLRAIIARIRQGKGTLGGLLVDPSIYEDIKGAVGNVERNQVLRALVRYSIKEDEQRPPPPRVEAPR